MRYAVSSSFDVAIWFLDRARADNAYLQPRMLQGLMFLAQGLYCASRDGERLVPADFVFDETGPLIPDIYRAFENGRPEIRVAPVSIEIDNFLTSVWDRFNGFDTLRLNGWISRLAEVEPGIARRDGSLIPVETIIRVFTGEPPEPDLPVDVEKKEVIRQPRLDEAPVDVTTATRPDGTAVIVKKWQPGVK